MFIDSFTIKQNLPAGASYTVFDKSVEDIEGTSQAVTLAEPMADGKVAYSYDVQAVGRTVESGEIVELYSASSNLIKVSLTTGVDANVASQTAAKVYRSGDELTVVAGEPVKVTVYNLAGAVVANAVAAEGTTTIKLNTNEVVIVKLGNKAVKL